MGPCDIFEAGQNGRCVYCDHDDGCHPAKLAPISGLSFTFAEAVRLFGDGAVFTRASWATDTVVLKRQDGQWWRVVIGAEHRMPWEPSPEERQASDWQAYYGAFPVKELV